MGLLMMQIPRTGAWRYVTSPSTYSIYSTNAVEYTEAAKDAVRSVIKETRERFACDSSTSELDIQFREALK